MSASASQQDFLIEASELAFPGDFNKQQRFEELIINGTLQLHHINDDYIVISTDDIDAMLFIAHRERSYAVMLRGDRWRVTVHRRKVSQLN